MKTGFIIALAICVLSIWGCSKDDTPQDKSLVLSKKIIVFDMDDYIEWYDNGTAMSDTIRIASGNGAYTVSRVYPELVWSSTGQGPLDLDALYDVRVQGDSMIIVKNILCEPVLGFVFKVTDSKNKQTGFGISNEGWVLGGFAGEPQPSLEQRVDAVGDGK